MKSKIILGFFGIISIISCKKNAAAPEIKSPSELIEVILSQPYSDSVLSHNSITVNGRLESYKSSKLSSRLMGNITEVLVREGQTVKQGQLLVRIKTSELQSKKTSMEAVIAEASSSYNLALKNHERFKTLFQQQSATEFEFDQAKLNLDAAKSKLIQSQKSLSEIQMLMDEANVRSPFDGSVIAVHAEVGTLATPGITLLTIETSTNLVVKALVPESHIQLIDKNKEVNIQLQHSGETCTGQIVNINPSSSTTGSQYELEIKPDPSRATHQWKSGMYVTAQIHNIKGSQIKQDNAKSIVIPKKALFEKGQLKGIYVVNEDNKALLRWVRTGKDYGDRIEILSGLSREENFITEADSRLFNGAPVHIK